MSRITDKFPRQRRRLAAHRLLRLPSGQLRQQIRDWGRGASAEIGDTQPLPLSPSGDRWRIMANSSEWRTKYRSVIFDEQARPDEGNRRSGKRDHRPSTRTLPKDRRRRRSGKGRIGRSSVHAAGIQKRARECGRMRNGGVARTSAATFRRAKAKCLRSASLQLTDRPRVFVGRPLQFEGELIGTAHIGIL